MPAFPGLVPSWRLPRSRIVGLRRALLGRVGRGEEFAVAAGPLPAQPATGSPVSKRSSRTIAMTPEFREQARIAAFALPAVLFMLVMFAVPWVRCSCRASPRSRNRVLDGRVREDLRDTLFARVALTTVEISIGATFFALLLAYPIAYFLSRQPPARRSLFALLNPHPVLDQLPGQEPSRLPSSWDMPASSTIFWARSASGPSSCCTTESA